MPDQAEQLPDFSNTPATLGWMSRTIARICEHIRQIEHWISSHREDVEKKFNEVISDRVSGEMDLRASLKEVETGLEAKISETNRKLDKINDTIRTWAGAFAVIVAVASMAGAAWLRTAFQESTSARRDMIRAIDEIKSSQEELKKAVQDSPP